MARVETVLRVFVASPGDVADARWRLQKVVEELNYTWSRTTALRLDLVRWETHAFSDIGADAQEVINRQLDEFDIFLGIMWKRLGQPTPRAESGTKEEFIRARRRYEANPKAVRIMFYFKDAPPSLLSDVDTGELDAVRRFRDEVAQSGVFYWTFTTTSKFEELVRQHLNRQLLEWGKTWGGVVEEPVRAPPASVTAEETKTTTAVPTEEPSARSITAIVFEEMVDAEQLRQRKAHDPEVIHRSFLEAQLILDSSPTTDKWGHLAVQQATALVAVALASRLAPGQAAQTYVARVCERIVGLRGLRITWGKRGEQILYALLTNARDRHDDDVLLWIKRHTRRTK